MKYHQLTSAQRYTISVLLKKKMSVKDIADTINVHYSTVYRELKRNKGRYHYHWGVAQKQCDERKRRMRRHRKFSLEMRKEIIALMVNEQWSPEQIRGWMLHKGKECVCVAVISASTAAVEGNYTRVAGTGCNTSEGDTPLPTLPSRTEQ